MKKQLTLFDAKSYKQTSAMSYDKWSKGAQWHGNFSDKINDTPEIHSGTLGQAVDRVHSLARQAYLDDGEGDASGFRANTSEAVFHPINVHAPEVSSQDIDRFRSEVIKRKHKYREDDPSMAGMESDYPEDREPKFSIADLSVGHGIRNVHNDRTANAMQAHGYFDSGQKNGPTTIKYRNDFEGQWPKDSHVSQVTDRAGIQTYGEYLDKAESRGKRVHPIDRVMASRGTRSHDLGGQFRSLLSDPHGASNLHDNEQRTSPWKPFG